jgi:hypothetical protein
MEHTRELIRDCIGIDDITQYWRWKGTLPDNARQRLEKAIRLRQEIAHGTTPRPIVHNQQYARRLPDFFRRLGRATDVGITTYLNNDFGIHTGW